MYYRHKRRKCGQISLDRFYSTKYKSCKVSLNSHLWVPKSSTIQTINHLRRKYKNCDFGRMISHFKEIVSEVQYNYIKKLSKCL